MYLRKIDTASLRPAAFYIVSSLFFMGNIKFFKMVLSYIGLNSLSTVLAVCLFGVLDLVLACYFLHFTVKNKLWKCFAVAAALVLLYGLPYFLNGMAYNLVQYFVFIVPFIVGAYLFIFQENGISRFFHSLSRLSSITVWLFLAYIIALFVCKPTSFGVFEVKEMSYGDIAYASIPFLFADLSGFLTVNGDRRTSKGIRVLVYVATLLYTGTRSALFCMVVVFVLQFLLHIKDIKKLPIRTKILAPMLTAGCLIFCLTCIPEGARLNVVVGDLFYETGNNGIGSIFDKIPEQTAPPSETSPLESQPGNVELPDPEDFSSYPLSTVYNVSAEAFMDISQAYAFYIVNNDCTISQTEQMLRRDMETKAFCYLVVNPAYYETALTYSYPINSRASLWKTALNEFGKSPMIGNGPLHYQQKYEQTFPHNLVLELLCDFGIMGFIIVGGLVLYLFAYAVGIAIKQRNKNVGAWLAFLTAYIPMHLLYHSLYFNGIFIFTVASLLAFRMKPKMNS